MRIEELRPGMKVRVVGERGPIIWDPDGCMARYIGMEVTIDKVLRDKEVGFRCTIKEAPTWVWSPEDFDPICQITEPDEQDFISILKG